MVTLYDRLVELNNSDMLPLHMPGHKRRDVIPAMSGVYGIDITEIDGFDDLHEPTGLIAGIEDRASDIYGAEKALISVNGSSAAIEAAIMAVCHAGDTIILPRASHKSVYYAVETGQLNPVYIEQDHRPESSVLMPPSVQQITEACESHREAACVLVTYPTYEGLTADLSKIAETVHSYGMILIADSAHGAHLGFGYGRSALQAGADIAVVSLHKMLPAPTQTALLLTSKAMCGSDAGMREMITDRINHYMQVFQSSSPSYVLMAGIEKCLDYMKDRLRDDLARTVELSERFRDDLRTLDHIDVGSTYDSDPLKVVIRLKSSSFSGRDLYIGLIEDYHIQCEMYGDDYVLAMFSPVDDESSFDRLKEALTGMDMQIAERLPAGADQTGTRSDGVCKMHIPQAAMTAHDAYGHAGTIVNLDEGVIGRVSAAYICQYPPGVPLIVPGEIIDREVYDRIDRGLETGLHITGLRDGRVAVLEGYE